MRPGLGGQVGFDEDDHVERGWEIGMEELGLISAGPDTIFNASVLEILVWDGLVIHPVALFTVWATACIRPVVGKAQRGIPT